ncbi:32468_t:CDS:1 [Racocetra persica]|uniref:32468_t:CDS:1 n=1 Tax=Racocetra persica TaxID=160502 RepID=A0ACA9QYU9_9GLOM|nr:32468_t:CDS:1 [Racocetra persica]
MPLEKRTTFTPCSSGSDKNPLHVVIAPDPPVPNQNMTFFVSQLTSVNVLNGIVHIELYNDAYDQSKSCSFSAVKAGEIFSIECNLDSLPDTVQGISAFIDVSANVEELQQYQFMGCAKTDF